MHCPDHDGVTVGACDTCGHEICEYCLQEVETPDEFECPECGEYGASLFDENYAEPGAEEGATFTPFS